VVFVLLKYSVLHWNYFTPLHSCDIHTNMKFVCACELGYAVCRQRDPARKPQGVKWLFIDGLNFGVFFLRCQQWNTREDVACVIVRLYCTRNAK
jgi:hypothetical protein